MGAPRHQDSVWRRSGPAWIAAVSVAIFCILMDGYVISSVRASFKSLDGLGIQLPPPTLLLLATRPQYFALFFFGAAFLSVLKELALTVRDRWLTSAAIFTVAVVVAGLTKFILYLPFLEPVKKLSDAK